MFEQEQSESPEKKVSTVVLLAAGGVLVATICATLASMLATSGDAPSEAGPPKAQAEVEADQPVTTSTSVSVAPDGSTSTVVITVSGKPRSEQARNAAGPAEGEPAAPEVVVTQTETEVSVPQTTKRPPSNPPSPSSSSSAAPSVPSETSETVPPTSGDPTKP